MEKLTASQSKALAFIHGAIEGKGGAPTLRELGDYMGYKAIGSAQDVVAALRRKGFLTMPEQQRARSLSLTEKARELFQRAGAVVGEVDDYFSIPCLGSVPAGNPLEAIEEKVDTLCISAGAISVSKAQADQLFAVKTSGLSMIEAGICDGDWLVVRCQQEAELGSVVVARLDGDVTCKRLMHDLKKGWYLKPENPDFENIYASERGFEVIGKVVALQRTLD